MLQQTFGRGFIEKLAQQQPVFARDLAVSERRVASGEFPIYIPLNIQNLRNHVGLPVKGIAPVEGTPYITTLAGMLKGTTRPNAARLFLNFLLEEDSQRMLANSGTRSTTGAEPTTLPPDRATLLKAKLLGTSDPDQQEPAMATFKEIFR